MGEVESTVYNVDPKNLNRYVGRFKNHDVNAGHPRTNSSKRKKKGLLDA